MPSKWSSEARKRAAKKYRRTPKGKAATRRARARYQARHAETLRERKRAWARKFPEKKAAANRKAMLKIRHGITVEEYDRMLRAQHGVCAICRQPPMGTTPNNRRLHVDHDHATGVRRGLLCSTCNRGVGHFYDDPALLRSAATYLEEHS